MYTYEIVQSPEPRNPRIEFDNITKMVCFHGRYNLGDKHTNSHRDYSGWDEMKKAIIKNENVAVIKPLYLYDHGGITMSTEPFSCKWDSGQVGFVYVTKKMILETFGGKNVSNKLKERAMDLILGEVKTYNQYLTGDVHDYTIFKDGVEVDSLSDVFGFEYCEELVQSRIESLKKL